MVRYPFFKLAIVLVCGLSTGALGGQKADVVAHVPVYDVDGRFGGWPANHGIWIWDNEILFGFSVGYYKDLGPERHAIDRQRPEEHWLARSTDGGETWSLEYPGAKGMLVGAPGMRHGTMPPDLKEEVLEDCPGGIDFQHPDFAMTLRMAGIHTGLSRLYYSIDRGHNWLGPFRVPSLGQKGIAARTDYVVNGPHDCTFLLTASKSNNEEGRPICARTTDGGKTWKFLSFVGPEPSGYSIMPSTVRLSPTDLLTTLRVREGDGEPRSRPIEAYVSHDDGLSWEHLSQPVADTGEGNPPALIKLQDGRLCLTYGVRAAPFRMEAKLSSDGGKTWSEALVLRDDGAGRDIGYPRTVQRPDGVIVTVYYFYDKSDVDRKIIATLWKAPAN
jgi:hypothetical protein